MVRDYYPEMQTLVGFPLDTSSKKFVTDAILLVSEVGNFFNKDVNNIFHTEVFEYFSIFPTVYCVGCKSTSINSTPSVELEINKNVRSFQEGLDGYLAAEGIAAFDCGRFVICDHT